jgi:hypothetical protein
MGTGFLGGNIRVTVKFPLYMLGWHFLLRWSPYSQSVVTRLALTTRARDTRQGESEREGARRGIWRERG